MDLLRRFGAFWYDFLVGDQWELFIGPIVVLAAVSVALASGLSPEVAGGLLFVGVTTVGAISLATSS